MDFGLFADIEKRNGVSNDTNFYYAHEMLIEGLTVMCRNKGQEPQWLPEYDKVVGWLRNNKGRGLMVRGDMGTGKSLICKHIIPRILKKKHYNDVSVYDAYDFAHTTTEDLDLRRFIVIDDIGVENEYNYFGAKRNIFSEVVDLAEQQGKILIITSNLTIEQIKEKYGTRTLDRLKALLSFVTFTGASMRSGMEGKPCGIPNRFRSYGIDFKTKEEAENFEQEQRLLRDYVEYNAGEIMIYDPDRKAWDENQPFRIYKKTAFAIMNYSKEEWDKRDWENDPDRIEYLKREFYG